MDIAHIIVAATLEELLPKFPQISVILDDPDTDRNREEPATAIYTHNKWQQLEYRPLFCYYLDTDATIGISFCVPPLKNGPYGRFAYFGVETEENLKMFQTHMHHCLKLASERGGWFK